MSILKKLSVITAGIASAAVTNLGSISPAVAINFNIVGGRFNDNTTFTGGFTFEPESSTISIFDITTNPGTSLPGARYTSSDILDDASISFAGSEAIIDFADYSPSSSLFPDNFLQLSVTISQPSSTGYPIVSSSTETNYGEGTTSRNVSAGSLAQATPVPFEFSPGVGILALGACGAIQQLRRKMQNRKFATSAFSPK